MLTMIVMIWGIVSKAVHLAIEKGFLFLYKTRLTLWLNRCKVSGKRVRKCSGKNRWRVEITDFADVYLFFRRLAAIVNSEVEVHNSIEHVIYICRLPRTSGILVLQSCSDGSHTVASIKIQADASEGQWLRISFIHRQYKSLK